MATVSESTSSLAQAHDVVEWPEEVVNKFWEVCVSVMDLRTAKQLEQKLRKGTGTECLIEINTCSHSHESSVAGKSIGEKLGGERKSEECCGHVKTGEIRNTLTPYCYKKLKDDTLGEELQRMCSRRFFIADHMGLVAESASSLFEKATEKRQVASTKEKAALQGFCLKLAIEQVIVQKVKKLRTRSEQMTVKDGGRLAYPQSYKIMFPKSHYRELNSVPADNMAELMDRGWTIVTNWMNCEDHPLVSRPKRQLRKDKAPAMETVPIHDLIAEDVEWLDMHSLFEDQTPFSPDPCRTDFALWINAAEIPAVLKGMSALSLKLTSLPFEMNQKTQAKLTINNNLFVDMYKAGSFFRDHADNDVEPERDNGRTFTFIYILRSPCQMRMSALNKTAKATTLNLQPNSMLIFKSRRFKYEIPKEDHKRVMIYYWCHGMNDV
ncbi:hypothetical protein GNI_014830 [Gregarina niphandrodes]|uniref:Prolyl 4-hydroxylase alpha subunit domain-containing protein n=2 Tax=Gregarina niphandrodes TaxID=110365 RepID=A0A023BCH7_GRENI|nr:hypothetical protein GNI_014830 [Gregarina niphandrodes]EZG83321.1 hypothetical protein GNI_014830 [Gregarina niphandrodes]|eukprot:XP_011128945.1 hypothetical protein GNI_014830 [Gregarina niphandrodes]